MNHNRAPQPAEPLSRFSFLIFWAAALFVLFWGLGDKVIIGSTHRWAEVTREMLLSRDFFHPTINGQPYFDKPLLSYWLIALTASITGKLNEWSIRLPSVIAALLSLGATVWLGRKLWSERIGRTAGWMMLTTYGFLMWGRRGEADMENLAATILAVSWYWARRERPSFGGYLVFYLICFIGAHTKGLTAVVIPILVLLPDLVRARRWRRHLCPAHIAALALGLAVYVAPFIYASMTRQNYHSSGLAMVFRENIARFFAYFDQTESFYEYFISVPELLLPWAPLLIVALASILKSIKSLRYETRWLLEAILIIFAFFTVSGERRIYYILPILPFCVLMIAVFLDMPENEKLKKLGLALQKALLAAGLFILMLTPAVGIGLRKTMGFEIPTDIMLGAPLLGLAGLALWMVQRFRPGLLAALLGSRRKMAPLIVAALLLMGGFFTWMQISLDAYETKKAFALELKSLVNAVAKEDIALYRRLPPKLLFYARLPVPVKLFHEPGDISNFLTSRRNIKVVVTQRKYSDELLQAMPPHMRGQPSIAEKIYPWEHRNGKKLVAWKIIR